MEISIHLINYIYEGVDYIFNEAVGRAKKFGIFFLSFSIHIVDILHQNMTKLELEHNELLPESCYLFS